MPPHGPGMMGAAHSHDARYPDDNWNLYAMLDTEQTTGLNVVSTENVIGIFKPHVLRLDEEPRVISDADAEVMIVARFTSPIHLRKIMVIGSGSHENHPNHVKCYVNHEGIDFTNVSNYRAVDSIDLPIDEHGTCEINVTNPMSFNNVSCLTFYFPSNHSGDEDTQTMIKYIGMQGEHTHYRREAVHADYELMCSHSEIPGVGNQTTIEHIT